jgi:ketosteroid isomerase-like protein
MSGEADDAAAALRVNAAFYAAFEASDLTAMQSVWSQTEPVMCIHPGRMALHGRDPVMDSWRQLFEHGATPIRYSDDDVVIIRGVAFVSCREHVGDQTLTATNILVWESGAWRLVHHSAGVLSEDESAPWEPPSTIH